VQDALLRQQRVGPGRWSVDAAAGIGVTWWAGAGIALGVGRAGAAGLVAAFWRPV
jgi:putative oxidoreductase